MGNCNNDKKQINNPQNIRYPSHQQTQKNHTLFFNGKMKARQHQFDSVESESTKKYRENLENRSGFYKKEKGKFDTNNMRVGDFTTKDQTQLLMKKQFSKNHNDNEDMFSQSLSILSGRRQKVGFVTGKVKQVEYDNKYRQGEVGLYETDSVVFSQDTGKKQQFGGQVEYGNGNFIIGNNYNSQNPNNSYTRS